MVISFHSSPVELCSAPLYSSPSFTRWTVQGHVHVFVFDVGWRSAWDLGSTLMESPDVCMFISIVFNFFQKKKIIFDKKKR
jgi:hypothetical protein